MSNKKINNINFDTEEDIKKLKNISYKKAIAVSYTHLTLPTKRRM